MTFFRRHIPGFALWVGILFTLLASFPAGAQQKKRVIIEQADLLEINEKIVANAARLLGNVRIRHNEVLMWCDSAYAYHNTNKVDAFGNVHIMQGDTMHLYAHRAFYNGDASFARAFGDVRLIKKNTTLYSDTVDYDLTNNIGYYDDTGKIVDSTNVLTSQIARYFVNQDIVYFYKNVEGKNEKYTLLTDTVQYNTVSGIFYIEGPTTIRDSSNTIYAEDGWYNSQTGEAQLLKNPLVYNEKQQLRGTMIDYNRATGSGQVKGAIEAIDFEKNTIVKGMNAWYDEKTDAAFVTDSAVFILFDKNDSLYLHADTLRTIPDTLKDEKIIQAYFGVRFYRSDLQGKCDSLVYFTRDSTVQFFREPVLWSENHQLSAHFIEMKSNADTPDEVRLIRDSYIVSKQDSLMYDQIKGKNMTGYVIENKLDRIDVDGNGQALYYANDKGKIIGLNRSESAKINIWFREGKIFRINFLSQPEGKLTPLEQVTDEERRLSGFEWKELLRPASKDDIYRKP